MRGAPPGCVTVETKGSFFHIDDTLGRYMRWPKHEAPRERPEWGSAEAGALQDMTWHDFTEWRIGPHPADQAKWEAAQALAEKDPEKWWPLANLPEPAPGLIIVCGPNPDDSFVWAPDAKLLE